MFEVIRSIILDELRAKGYAPNASDVVGAVHKIVNLVKLEVEFELSKAQEAAAAEAKPAAKPVEVPKVTVGLPPVAK